MNVHTREYSTIQRNSQNAFILRLEQLREVMQLNFQL